jgi:hypothetical protein
MPNSSLKRLVTLSLISFLLVSMVGCGGGEDTTLPGTGPGVVIDSEDPIEPTPNSPVPDNPSSPVPDNPSSPVPDNPSNPIPVAVFSTNPTSGLAALQVSVDASQSSDSDGNIVEYQWNFGDGNTTLAQTTSHIYSQPGSYTITLTVTDNDGNSASASNTVNVFASIDNSSAIVPNGVMFYDNFDYVVGRDDPSASDLFKNLGGWRWAKTQQSFGSGRGYLYTTDRIPGYSGTFPGRNSNRVLVMEARPATLGGQTDFYLQYGEIDFPADTIPANVWFQFWIYPNYYDDPNNQEDQLSQFSWKNKFIYPCDGSYPCSTNKWLVEMGSNSNSPLRDEIGEGNFFTYLGDARVGSINNANDPNTWWRDRPGQTNTNEYIAMNRWNLVKIHLDTSQPSGNTYEMWIKPMGGQWSKVAEWIGNVTPGFTWDIPAEQVGGHRVFRMPTTMPGGVGTADLLLDSWIYMDDFAMATSESELPVYPY